MKNIFTLFSILLLSWSINAQSKFCKKYSQFSYYSPDISIKLYECADGGYLLPSYDLESVQLIKLDEFGDIVWAKNFNGQNHRRYTGLHESSNGEIFFSATFRDTATLSSATHYKLFKLSSTGDLIWTKEIQNNSSGCQSASIVGMTGFIYVIGTYFDDNSHIASTAITAITLDGTLFWQKTYETDTYLASVDALVTNNNKIVIAASSGVNSNLFQIDGNGNVDWFRKLNFGFTQQIRDIELADNDDILVVGVTKISNLCTETQNVFAARYSTTGEILWGKRYHMDSVMLYGASIHERIDGGLVIVGNESIAHNDIAKYSWLLMTDSQGNTESVSYLRPNEYTLSISSVMNDEHELTILGIDGTCFEPDSRITLTHTNSAFETTCAQQPFSFDNSNSFYTDLNSTYSVITSSLLSDATQNTNDLSITFEYVCSTLHIDNLTEKNHNINTYPNPTQGQINFKEIPTQVKLYNISGELILKVNSPTGIDLNNLPDGMYLIKQTLNNQTIIEQVVKQ